MYLEATAIALLACTLVDAQQQSKTDVPQLPVSHVYSNTLVFARIAPDIVSTEAADDSQSAKAFKRQVQWLKSIASNKHSYVAIDIPLSPSATWNRIIVSDQGDASTRTIREKLRDKDLQLHKDGGFIAFSPNHDQRMSKQSVQNDRKELLESLDRVATYPIQIGIAAPDHVRRIVKELPPSLPVTLDTGISTQLIDSVRSIAIGLNPQNWTIEFSILCDSEKTAQTLNLKRGPLSALSQPDKSQPGLLEQLKLVLPKSQKNLINVSNYVAEHAMPVAKDKVIGWTHNSGSLEQRQQLFLSSLAYLLGQTQLLDVTNQIKQIGLACHNFESANAKLPPGNAARDQNGIPLLSWRVHILPYLGEVKLYERFRLNEPWDSPHNKELLSTMPKAYMSSAHATSELPDGHTTLLSPSGKDTILGDIKSWSISNVTDGTSNTIWVLEAKPEFAVPWTSPQDYAFDVNNPAKGILDVGNGQFVCGLADGSVLRLPLDMSPKNLVHLFQKSDGNVVEFK